MRHATASLEESCCVHNLVFSSQHLHTWKPSITNLLYATIMLNVMIMQHDLCLQSDIINVIIFYYNCIYFWSHITIFQNSILIYVDNWSQGFPYWLTTCNFSRGILILYQPLQEMLCALSSCLCFVVLLVWYSSLVLLYNTIRAYKISLLPMDPSGLLFCAPLCFRLESDSLNPITSARVHVQGFAGCLELPSVSRWVRYFHFLFIFI